MKIVANKFEFIDFKDESINLNFSTAKNGLDFNMNTKVGIENLNNIRNWFGVEEVGYLRQIHSDIVVNYDGKIHSGDALIVDKPNIAIGVFTADCVPVLIYSKSKRVIAAVHSGWQGTLSQIVLNTVKKMEEQYAVKPEDLKVYIGPHNRDCCYEFGEDIVKKFKEIHIYKNEKIYKNGKMNLVKCIFAQLLSIGVEEGNIKDLNICTFCNKEYELHSYRKNNKSYGRMFSFIYMKE